MSLELDALKTTAWLLVGCVIALALMVIIVGIGFDYARDIWRHYCKKRSHGYSMRESFRMAINFINGRI